MSKAESRNAQSSLRGPLFHRQISGGLCLRWTLISQGFKPETSGRCFRAARGHLEEEVLVLEQLLHVVAPHGGPLAVRERVHSLDAHPRQGGAHARQVRGAGRETGPPTPLVFGGLCNRFCVLNRGAGGKGQATEGAAFRVEKMRRAYVDLAFQASVEGAVNLRD
jgi:hypothetical protein